MNTIQTPGYRPPHGHRHKLALISTPLQIIEKISPLAYRVQLPNDSKMHDVISIAHLQKFRGTNDHHIRPLPITIDGMEEYEVESIDGERKNGDKMEYLVRWKGYGELERTWEPEEHLSNAKGLFDQYIASRRPLRHSLRLRSGNGE